MLKPHQDAYGYMIYDYYHQRGGFEVVERDDGYINVTPGPALYFSPFEEWFDVTRELMSHAHGRILDIGCGAGRTALYLQQQGYHVVAVDNSPKAVEVCELRGLYNAQVLPITQISATTLGIFGSILMIGNNFGLFGSYKRARWLLRRMYHMTKPDGRIIAESRDPYATDDADHLRYHQRNRERGRMGGQLRIRVRYKHYATPYFDYLLVSEDEMCHILADTGWQLTRVIPSEHLPGAYGVVIEKR